MSAPFSLMTWNVNSIRARLDNVLTYLDEHQPDVACLQETKVEDQLFPRVPFMELGYQVALNGTKGYAGVATLTKRAKPEDVQLGFAEGKPDKHRRILACTFAGVRIYNLYVPNGTALGTDAFTYKLEWLERLRVELATRFSAGDSVILCGDFNVARDERDVWSVEAMAGCTHFTPEEHAALDGFEQLGLRDCFRKHDQAAGRFTWFDYRDGCWEKKHGLRIDYVYASAPMYERCAEVVHDWEPREWDTPSDHVPVTAKFS
ncbi:exodeoxyribonuclease III [Enhygromyxa salina]|uniref:Exodeoxyribonuclease III n=1 Tax=Enhygromyxa salina TaxID=215803 RepID=A0A2S9XTM3_9BACT|nr:exodeoxyribonuclease III [Enhygromyxa salina]PRP96184.1 Exodeoxyribonuclease III [Enhygromyxa salina]